MEEVGWLLEVSKSLILELLWRAYILAFYLSAE